MDALTQQVTDLYAQADEQGRKKIQDDLRDLQTSLDSEWDVFVRLASLVSGINCLELKHVT
jgi:demethylsterigmatocystin 6-O-methyltransferase